MKKYQTGGLAAAADPGMYFGDDPATGYLGILASQHQTTPEARDRAREILDSLMEEDTFADEQEILEQFKQTAEEARQALMEARQRVLADKYDKSQMWLAAAQALGTPTRTGGFGETLGNLAGSLRQPLADQQAFRRAKDEQLLGLDQAMTGVDQSLLENEFRLAQVRREMMGDLGKEALKILGKSSTSRPYVSPGSRRRDTEMATTLNDWQTQKKADAVKSLAEMRDAIEMLGESDVISGPLVGIFPKLARDVIFPESANVQELVETTAQRSLKAILGGQFGEREGQMLLERTFNPRLDESVNRERAFRLYKMLELAAQQKDKALEYFSQYGTMEGFDGKMNWTIEDFELTHEVRLEDGTVVIVPESWGKEEIEDWYAKPVDERKQYQKFSRGGSVFEYKKGGRRRKRRYAEGGVVDIGDLGQTSELGPRDEEDEDALRDILLTLGAAGGGAGAGLGLEAISNRLQELHRGIPRVSRGERLVGDALELGGVDPRKLTADVKRARRSGVPMMPMDASGRMGQELTERAMMAGGDEAERAIGALESRHEGSAQRVGRQVEKSLRTPEFFAEEQKLTDRLYSRAKEAYEKAYSENPAIKVPKFWATLFDSKYGQQAIEHALEFMELEGKPIGKEDAIGMVRKPTLQFFDMVKRGFDQIIRKEEAQGSTPLGHALRGQRNKLVKFLDDPKNVTPAYQEARRQYKGDLEVLQALETGRKEFHRMAPQELKDAMEGMSVAEKHALRTGVAQRLYEVIYGPSTDVKAARRIIGSEEMKNRLQLLFDKPREWRVFEAALEREMEMFESEKKSIRRAESGRTRRMTDDLVAMDDPLSKIKDKMGRGPLAWALRILPPYWGRGRKRIELSEKDADEIVRIMTTGDLKELDALGERLSEVQTRTKKRRGRRGKAGAVGTAVGAALAALGITGDDEEEEEDVVSIEDLD